jgi:hypothetical protein
MAVSQLANASVIQENGDEFEGPHLHESLEGSHIVEVPRFLSYQVIPMHYLVGKLVLAPIRFEIPIASASIFRSIQPPQIAESVADHSPQVSEVLVRIVKADK